MPSNLANAVSMRGMPDPLGLSVPVAAAVARSVQANTQYDLQSCAVFNLGSFVLCRHCPTGKLLA